MSSPEDVGSTPVRENGLTASHCVADISTTISRVDLVPVAEAAVLSAQQRIWSGRSRTVEDADNLDKDEVEEHEAHEFDDFHPRLTPVGFLPVRESNDDAPYEAISEWDHIQEQWNKATGNFSASSASCFTFAS